MFVVVRKWTATFFVGQKTRFSDRYRVCEYQMILKTRCGSKNTIFDPQPILWLSNDPQNPL